MTTYIIANWKMQMSLKEITNWLEVYAQAKLNLPDNIKVLVAPSMPYLPLLKEARENLGFSVCAQDISEEEKGAHTGETGAFQVQEFTHYAIIGHSERHENLDTIKRKLEMCAKNTIQPILCFPQIENLNDYLTIAPKQTIFAWEDPANISHDQVYQAKNTNDIEQGVQTIRQTFSPDKPLIYGGSVNKQNITDLAKITGLNGVLVGNASLDPKHFIDIISTYI
jgi:triosephosphate isomerase